VAVPPWGAPFFAEAAMRVREWALLHGAATMPSPRIPARVVALLTVVAAVLLAASAPVLAPFGCASGEVGFFFQDAGDDAPADDLPTGSSDAGAALSAAASVGAPDDAEEPFDDADAPLEDAGSSGAASPPPWGPPFDAGEGGVCGHSIASGDLVIVEILVESTTGTGDHGEWLEVESTRDCALSLNGLAAQCPDGAKVISLQVQGDVWLAAHGTFLLADSANPAVNHDLPGIVLGWSGDPGDVLRNEGATITLLFGSTIVDSVTYPSLKLTPGVSVAFPADCPPTVRPTWTNWQDSVASWFPAFHGTPNAANADVHCPVQPDD
jgi:hypothetical protein